MCRRRSILAEMPVIVLARPRQRAGSDIDVDRSDTRLGHFQLLNPIGHGGMGSVYRALDESLQRYVALKVIRGGARTATEMDRLMQEARAQARVNHPHVVHIYYVSPDTDDPFLAMELVNGPTLATRLRETTLTYSEVVRIAIETTEALQQSARFDVIHGDIKPANILLEDGVRVKLSDFGLSQRISRSGEQAKSISGTPAYMAPEVCLGAEPTIFSDQYSLGVMLFQLTFGRSPYSVTEDSVTAMLNAHKQAMVEFPKPWPQHLPDEWKHVLSRMLAKEPAGRFPSYGALWTALSSVRPLNLPDASWLVRGFAWNADVILLLVIVAVVLIPTQVGPLADLVNGNPFLAGLVRIPSFLVPALAALIQARWKTTPAKRLLKIRIVDQHGLRPGAGSLALRSVFQFSAVWVVCLTEFSKSSRL